MEEACPLGWHALHAKGNLIKNSQAIKKGAAPKRLW